MKERYINIMEKTLSAYTREHIDRYFDDVKRDGLTEHGFPRLASNIGVLIAHGRRGDLLPVFIEMMSFCCESMPRSKAANDFSVREVITAIREVEAAGVVSPEVIAEWRKNLASVDPYTLYDVVAMKPEDPVKNWALFSGVSEFFRKTEGLSDYDEFIDVQLESQFKWFDENDMYMDDKGDIHHPLVYDIVPRFLFSVLLHEGYRGKHYERIDGILRRSALLSLKMQSPIGELPFGGRSNQFLHNEADLLAICEFEAARYKREGNMTMAAKFRAAAERAASVIEEWLSLDPIYHIKNRFPTETRQGCENYAYFDKYMITAASMAYLAYL